MLCIIGIDEAGRGPLAGPVAVGAVRLPRDFDIASVVGAKDSKQMTPLAREKLYEKMCILRAAGEIDFAVAFSPAAMIDEEGIVPAIRAALASALEGAMGTIAPQGHGHFTNAEYREVKLVSPDECDVRLDGGLRAPDIFKHQTTIIRGDETELAISLASVAAKVERDRVMREIAKQFPAYGFEIHKGYGTAKHLQAIKDHGLCLIHRASFCSKIS